MEVVIFNWSVSIVINSNFVDTYVKWGDFEATVPNTVTVAEPIVKEAKNFIVMIGDGMGVNQTLLFDYMENNVEYSDGEDMFYGYYLPYIGTSRTQSLSGITDSAAGGTALATGYKTYNKFIGRDKDGDFTVQEQQEVISILNSFRLA